jgi:hypothetical protein
MSALDEAAASVKWKKRRRHGAPGVGGDNSRPAELSAALARCALRGALAHGGAWVRCDSHVGRLLDRLCLGRVQRGAAAQQLPETDPPPPRAQQQQQPGQPHGPRGPQPPQMVRLSMLEAVFLAHGLECLTLFDVQVRPARGRGCSHSALTRSAARAAASARRRACCHRARPRGA